MSVARDESAERLIHRLEAFSDIVIGFSLAMLAMSLTIPVNGARGLLQQPEPLVAFIITFALVCGMWWAHHRLFVHWFVPIAPMVVLNFLTLAGVSFAVYSVQLMLHKDTLDAHGNILIHGHSSLDFAFYLGALALVYGLLAVQYFYGWSVRRMLLPPSVRLHGLRSALMLAGVAAASAVIAFLSVRYGMKTSGIQYFGFVIVGYAVVLRLAFRFAARNEAKA
jgi:uncharacterized membrane protein